MPIKVKIVAKKKMVRVERASQNDGASTTCGGEAMAINQPLRPCPPMAWLHRPLRPVPL